MILLWVVIVEILINRSYSYQTFVSVIEERKGDGSSYHIRKATAGLQKPTLACYSVCTIQEEFYAALLQTLNRDFTDQHSKSLLVVLWLLR